MVSAAREQRGRDRTADLLGDDVARAQRKPGGRAQRGLGQATTQGVVS